MAFHKEKQRRWTFFISVHFRTFIVLFLVLAALGYLLTELIFRNLTGHELEREKGNIQNYALEAARSAYIPDGPWEDTEVYGIDIYGEFVRMMVLDQHGLVLQDSREEQEDERLVNELTLAALSGSETSAYADGVFSCAVPIEDKSGDTRKVVGCVVAEKSLLPLQEQLRQQKETVQLICLMVTLAGGILFYLICYSGYLPLKDILAWLRNFGNAELRKKERPRRKTRDEYQLILEAVDDATKDMLTLDQTRREFVSNVSHELKTPLSAIKVLTESLLLQQNVPEEIYREFLGDINTEIDRMNNIVSDLLTLTRLDEGGSGLNLSNFMVSDMLEMVLKRVEPLSRERDIKLEITESEVFAIEADETKLTLAMTNLIQNAVKYNKDKGLVSVTCRKDKESAVITIRDTGIGIEEEHFDKLFDRFYRVDKARDRNSGGSGLGLSITKRIIDRHRGEIRVESTPNVGSTFTVLLPLVQTKSGEES
ncbi:MAG: ATP-binding protein [Lachnospiraceae bacterium]|nr:ATP-binding protein [Lachnospiraceae bacterium]